MLCWGTEGMRCRVLSPGTPAWLGTLGPPTTSGVCQDRQGGTGRVLAEPGGPWSLAQGALLLEIPIPLGQRVSVVAVPSQAAGPWLG